MKLQKQPNEWSCLPTAFAMAIDVPIAKVIKYIGHDGSEIVFPKLDPPYHRRSFHPQELIDRCLRKNFSVVQIEKQPVASAKDHTYKVKVDIKRMEWYLVNYTGVLIGKGQSGKPHAVAWDGRKVLDPNGTEYSLVNFTTEIFFLIIKFNKTK